VMKNVTGYDLCKLMAGSWGTLAVMTDVTLKTLALQERRVTLICHNLDETSAVQFMSAALGSPFDIVTAAHIPERAMTAVQIEGLKKSVSYRVNELKTELSHFGELSELVDQGSGDLWTEVREVESLLAKTDLVWKISTKPSDGPKFVQALRENSDLEALYDWGGGLVWIGLAQSNADLDVRAALAPFGGHATLFKATQEQQAKFGVFHPLPEGNMKLTRGVKATFDPKNILNPGRQFEAL
ncbi:glycolate oxidase subunit GlcE, partial [Alphaproteobacteria bacterium]|nr:glycolate oxidase subunit GlcE [Alphaproteobacteria bacterium]